MALYDVSDLLVRVKLYAARPATDEALSDGQWYAILTEAEKEWVGTIAAMYPYPMLSAPTKLSSEDSGLTYHFAASATPLAVQIFDAPNGALLRPGAFWDSDAGYVWEGERIRFPRNATRTFADGPYARAVFPPTGNLSATATLTLKPDYTRILIVYRSLIKFASIGDLRDPTVWEKREHQAWLGNPDNPSDIGILGQLKLSNPFYGAAAYSNAETTTGLDMLRTVAGYTAI